MSKGRKAVFKFDAELFRCMEHGCNTELKSMLNKDLAQAYDDYGTLLHHIITFGNDVISEELIRLGANVDSLNKCHETPLMHAVECQYVPIVKVLLDNNANIDIVNPEGKTALRMALESYCCNVDVVELFSHHLKKQYTTEEVAKKLIDGGCDMHHAANLGDIDVMECMLKQGVSVESKSSGSNALHAAAQQNRVIVAEWLIDHGAEVDVLNKYRQTALYIAAHYWNKDMVEVLLKNGADPNYECFENLKLTPLFTVFFFDGCDPSDDERTATFHYECAKLLLKYGAIPKNSIEVRRTMFDFALYLNWDKEIELLISHLAMLEVSGTPITDSVMFCNDVAYQYKIAEFKQYHKCCSKILKITFFEKMSLIDLLNVSNCQMRHLVRNDKFIPRVMKICSKHKLRKVHSHYFDTLTESMSEASRVVELEEEAISTICKIFNGDYNQCYTFARRVIDYLNLCDIECLIQV